MEDPTRTRKTLDDLADLFLTGTAPTSRLVHESSAKPRAAEPAKKLEKRKSLQLTDPLDSPADVPPSAPIGCGNNQTSDRIMDPIASVAIPSRRNDSGPPSDSSLHRPDTPFHLHQKTFESKPAPQAWHVEAALLGNLPGFSGPWLTQYAYRLAQVHGPVGIISLDDHEAVIELVAPNSNALNHFDGSDSTRVSQSDGLTHKLTDLATDIRAWLIRFQTPLTPESRSQVMTVNRWTLLCGADDAAVVGAYRLIKQLATIDPENDPDEIRLDADRHIGVMIMGSDDITSRAAAHKLSQAAHGFLNTPVQCIGASKQMRPVQHRMVGSFTGEQNRLWLQIKDFLDPHHHRPSTRRSRDSNNGSILGQESPTKLAGSTVKDDWPQLPTETMEDRKSLLEDVDSPFVHVPQSPNPITREPLSSDQLASPSSPLTDRRKSASQTRRQPSTPPASSNPESTRANDVNLCTLLGGNVELLKARCPQHEQVQLGLDEQGHLHLLMDQRCGHASCTGVMSREAVVHLRAAIIDLMYVNRWAHEHINLLKLTQPNHEGDWQDELTLHLFSDQAIAATTLVGQLGDLVKIHLLQKVQVDKASTWFCTALN